ncbi:MAG: GIY-YIG nuclease family protein [Candidatus Sumerlaeia bacterium]|nr:GIY-YIG nuclease family protein [Candidatus Sumerlaeia bacterium]
MDSATIKLFLPNGDAKRLRTGEVSNWTGKALAAPRTEIDELLAREELGSAGVYLLLGEDAATGRPLVYIGEAEVVRDRLRQHKSRDFWTSVVIFVSKDENLTKAHVKYLESRLIKEAQSAARYKLENANESNPRLPESDREDMEVFLGRIRQVLPVLGSDVLLPIGGTSPRRSGTPELVCKIKAACAKGRRTESGFVVYKDSTAVRDLRPSADQAPNIVTLRERLVSEGVLVERDGLLHSMRDMEFSSPSAAAAVVHGGSANGLTSWKDSSNRSLKEIEGD